jgi:hypothetical protein
LRAPRTLNAGLLLPTRFRALGEDGSFRARFDAAFALDAGPILFVFDFVVFFDLVRAAIGNSPRASVRARLGIPCADTALQNSKRTFCQRNS